MEFAATTSYTHGDSLSNGREWECPSGAWWFFGEYFETQQEAGKARWTREYFRLRMGATESPHDYLG